MKAEHRKELETNILADRMGRVLRTSKETSSTAIWYWVVGVGLVLLAAFLLNRYFIWSADRAATAWGYLESGDEQALLQVAQQFPTQNVGKAARFQLAFRDLWFDGISKLGANPNEAKSYIFKAQQEYAKLVKDCQNDPVFLAEALYSLAVIEETGAIDDPELLKTAVTAYKRVVKEAKDSAFAKLAQDRLDVLDVPAAVEGEDAKAREEREAREIRLAEIRGMYNYLKTDLRMRGMPGMPGMPQMEDAQFKKFLEEFRAKHPEIQGKAKPGEEAKLPEIKGPEVKAPDGKVPETKTPDGKTPDPKTPGVKGPDGKTLDPKLPAIAPPPPVPIPDAPGAKAPDPTTPAAPPDEKKSDKK
jgi:hypothetical protein